MVLRENGGTQNLIRVFNGDGTVANVFAAAAFTSGAEWMGVVSVVTAAGNAQLQLDGVNVGAPWTLGWKHFFPTSTVQAGTQALTVRSYTGDQPA